MEVEGLKPAHILKKVHCRGRWQQSPPPPPERTSLSNHETLHARWQQSDASAR